MLLSRGDYWSSAAGNGPPQHSYSQDWPASTHLQYTHTNTCKPHHVHTHIRYKRGIFTLSFTFTALLPTWPSSCIHPCSLSHTQAPTSTHNTTVTHITWGCSYASYTTHIPRSLSCQIMHSLFSCSLSSFHITHNHNHFTLSDQKNMKSFTS